MDAKFTFDIDRPLGLLRIAMSGLFTPECVAAFFEERSRAYAALGCAPNAHITLIDVRAMKIQPQLTVAAFHAMLADPQYRSRRLAFVASPTLARSQLMRALNGRECRCFADPCEAEAWLIEDGERARWAASRREEAVVLPFRRVG
jgi:hypothetical protein